MVQDGGMTVNKIDRSLLSWSSCSQAGMTDNEQANKTIPYHQGRDECYHLAEEQWNVDVGLDIRNTLEAN